MEIDNEVTSSDKLGTSLGYLVGPCQPPAAMASDGANVNQQEALDLHLLWQDKADGGGAESSARVIDSSTGGASPSAGVDIPSAEAVGPSTDFETVAAERVLALLQSIQSSQTESAITLASAASDFFFQAKVGPILGEFTAVSR